MKTYYRAQGERIIKATGRPIGGRVRSPRTLECRDWLRRRLENGPVPTSEIIAEAARLGYSSNALRYARRTLKIKPRPLGYGGPWMMSLPKTNQNRPAETSKPESDPLLTDKTIRDCKIASTQHKRS